MSAAMPRAGVAAQSEATLIVLEAAKEVGKSRATLWRAAKTGALSVTKNASNDTRECNPGGGKFSATSAA